MATRSQLRDASLTALLIAADRDLAQQVQTSVNATRCFEILSEIRGYPQEQTLEIRLRQIQPEVILLDLSSNFEIAAKLIHYASEFQPPVLIVGLHTSNDPEVLIRALRAGASEFLYAPFDPAAQKEAAQRIRRIREPEQPEELEFGKVITLTSTKPGSGASTLATQTAFSLKRLTGKRVLLADLDVLSGSVAFALKLNPTYTLLDALERSNQLDPALWSSLTANANGVDVLAAPDTVMSGEIEYNRLHDVLEYSRVLYDWIVLDLPTVFNRLSLFALSEADQSYLVTTSELPSLHLARRAVSMLRTLGYEQERYHMVVNRLSTRDGITTTDMQKILNCPIFASFPNDYYALHKVVTRAEPLAPDSDFGQAMDRAAARIAGLARQNGKEGGSFLEHKPALSEG